MIELNSAKEVILFTGDTIGIYKISDITLEYDAIFDDPYATSIGKAYIRENLIPYTKDPLSSNLKKKTLTGKLT